MRWGGVGLESMCVLCGCVQTNYNAVLSQLFKKQTLSKLVLIRRQFEQHRLARFFITVEMCVSVCLCVWITVSWL